MTTRPATENLVRALSTGHAQLEIELGTELHSAAWLWIATGIDRLNHRVDGTKYWRASTEVSIRTCKVRVIECVISVAEPASAYWIIRSDITETPRY